MPCVLYAEKTRDIIIVKRSWCENIKCAETVNKGITRTKRVKFFYSNEKTHKPNFELDTEDEFDAEKNACYFGFILHICGKKFGIIFE